MRRGEGEGKEAKPPNPHFEERAGGARGDPRDVPSWFLQVSVCPQGAVADLQQQGWVGPGLGLLQAEGTDSGTGLGHIHTALMGLPVRFVFPPGVAVPREGAMGPRCPVQQGEQWRKGFQSGKETLSPPEFLLMLIGVTLRHEFPTTCQQNTTNHW